MEVYKAKCKTKQLVNENENAFESLTNINLYTSSSNSSQALQLKNKSLEKESDALKASESDLKQNKESFKEKIKKVTIEPSCLKDVNENTPVELRKSELSSGSIKEKENSSSSTGNSDEKEHSTKKSSKESHTKLKKIVFV